MKYTIYRGKKRILTNFQPEGTVTERIMGEETASLSFTLPNFIEFHIGDRITIYEKDYFLSTEPIVVKKSTREFQYSLMFYSLKYKLADFQLFFYDNENELTLPDFDIMGNADTCLDIVLANANRADSGWTKGVVDATEVKNVTFSDCNLLEAISKIAEEFKLEYWIDSDKSIHFTERKPVSGYSFEYGKAKGLKNITRSVLEGGKLVTRLYVKGSDKNLPKNYRGGQKNLRIDVPCLEKNINIYGLKEHTEKFEKIYPKRVGTVTAVDENDPNRFTDADLDFDLNAYNEYGTTVLLNGVAVKVIFQTGQLAGYRLELIEAGGFNSATRTFYLNPNKDEKDLQIPSAIMRPSVGDKYILEDLMMPQAYVLLAESELKAKGQEYLDQNSKDRCQYAAESDIILFKNLNINIQLGATAHFIDTDFNLDDDIRITGLQKNIQNKFDVKFDLSEVTSVSSIVKSYYEQQEQKNTIINQIKYNAELARRNYLFSREFHDNVFDGEGYFDMENIKPLSIETKMLSLGSRLQQFALPGVDFKIQNNNALSNTAGKIAHQTINPTGVREWNIASNAVIGITPAFNYIYVKCQKVGTNASFVVTEAQIKVEADPDFYHFEVGYLSSVIDSYRKIKTTYGFAQLNPAELSIGKISDPTGNNYIELAQDKINIKAKVEFTGDSPAFTQVANSIKIGGRNTFKKSTAIDTDGTLSRDIEGFSIIGNSSNNSNIRLKSVINSNGEWTISGFVKSFYNERLSFKIADFSSPYQSFSFVGDKKDHYFEFTFNVQGLTASLNFIDIAAIQNSEYVFSKIKIEKGNKATDYTPAPEDIELSIKEANNNSASALAQAQNAQNTAAIASQLTSYLSTTVDRNVVATGTLLVGDVNGANGGISGVTDRPNRESIRIWTGADYENRYTAPHQQLDNGLTCYFNPYTGKPAFIIGYNVNTRKVTFDIYDQDTGLKVSAIGSQGIMFTGYIPESYKKYNLRKLITTSFIKSELESEMQNNLTKFLIGQARWPITPDDNWKQYNIGSITNYTAYSYYEGRNFESADNAKYAGFYQTSNKFDEHIPNGIYVRQFVFENQYTGNSGGRPINNGDMVIYPTEAWKIENGKIVGSIAISVNQLISATGTRLVDFPVEDYEN